ncbi:MAG: helix-turn-helix domain-containing protein [bacterium]
MPSGVSVVLALVLGVAARGRLRSALRDRHHVQFIERVAELEHVMTTTTGVIAAVLVEPRDIDGRSVSDALTRMCATDSAPPIVGCCRAGVEHTADIRALVLAGVNELVFEGVDDAGYTLRAILESAQRARVGERAASALKTIVPETLWPFIAQVTAYPDTQRVADLADALGYHRKTLVNHCALAHAPPPQELIAWCRLAVAAELLQTTPRTIESIALGLDYPSDTSLRNMMKRYTGLTASAVRDAGGVRVVVAALQTALRTLRRDVKSSSGHRG